MELTYLKGKDNVIADALSQISPLEQETAEKDILDAIWVHHNIRNSCHRITARENKSGMQTDPVLSQAREGVYWPGIIEVIKEYFKRCHICQSTRPSHQKEPLIQHDVPKGPWEKVGIDIFQHKFRDYLLEVDYFSNFPLVRFLNNQTAVHRVNILKMLFSEHGILTWVFTDQWWQFTSVEFQEFVKCYRFEILNA